MYEEAEGLPEGWRTVRHEAPAGAYNVYHGPSGQKLRSKAQAWRVHEEEEAEAAQGDGSPSTGGLPEGWSTVRHEAPAGAYNVYHGPSGQKLRSKAQAWRVHEEALQEAEDAAAKEAEEASAHVRVVHTASGALRSGRAAPTRKHLERWLVRNPGWEEADENGEPIEMDAEKRASLVEAGEECEACMGRHRAHTCGKGAKRPSEGHDAKASAAGEPSSKRHKIMGEAGEAAGGAAEPIDDDDGEEDAPAPSSTCQPPLGRSVLLTRRALPRVGMRIEIHAAMSNMEPRKATVVQKDIIDTGIWLVQVGNADEPIRERLEGPGHILWRPIAA